MPMRNATGYKSFGTERFPPLVIDECSDDEQRRVESARRLTTKKPLGFTSPTDEVFGLSLSDVATAKFFGKTLSVGRL
jgi:hypothetical protein